MLKLNEEVCIGCGICESSCPFAAIEMVADLPVIGDSCTLCGACVDSCDVEALSIETAESSGVADISEWKDIFVYCEFRGGVLATVSLELLGIGRTLADIRGVKLSAVLIGSETGDVADTLIGHGADVVYRVDTPELAGFSEDSYTKVLTRLILDNKPEIVLAGATAIGRSFIPAVATTLNAGLTADCTKLEIREEDGALLQTRPAFGGNIMATIVCPAHRPQMSTVRPKVMKALEFDSARTGEIIDVEIPAALGESRIKVLESVVSEESNVNIQEAEILVSGGRGLESEKGFALLKTLADSMDANVSASRAVVDAGWIPYPHQVGQTGKTVAPKLYIACGISGAVQHVAGMQSSETIVAINRDENAPIFDVADFGLVGDIQEIIPKLIRKIEEKRGA
ncbi:electron transfer flavoprotein subunit alpha [Desulfosediminicola ganghwensis]|uniref:electron transfer flavoprotein subunit alpha n=1 Tax=Desulfosediminicola ganghwensis TaxID=2569540 RepID=UPI0010AD7435|nr:electron transfer flavoprotein subunit alpha [Desulfosediminicola ganghwensis]